MNRLLDVCLFFGTLLAVFTPARTVVAQDHQQDLSSKLRNLGATVETDTKGNAVSLGMAGSMATNDDIALLAGLGCLEELDLSNFEITEVGLKHLSGLRTLKTLSLAGTNFIDADVKQLAPLTRIESLDLSYTAITDAAIAELKQLRKLESLNLSDTKITDAVVPHLQHFPNIESLHLSGTAITDAAIVDLKQLRKLERLNLSETKITDAAFVDLKQLRKLESLNLSDTKITDNAVVHLKQLPELKQLILGKTRVSPSGLRTLQAALPDLQITRLLSIQILGANGHAVIDTDGASIVFESVPCLGGASAGGSLYVSGPAEFLNNASCRGAIRGASFTASNQDGVVTIKFGKHRIEVRESGDELVIGEDHFPLGANKRTVTIDAQGKGRFTD